MYACMVFFALWLRNRPIAAVYAVALAVLLAWPFAGALGIPLALEIVVQRRNLGRFIVHGLAAVAIILVRGPEKGFFRELTFLNTAAADRGRRLSLLRASFRVAR